MAEQQAYDLPVIRSTQDEVNHIVSYFTAGGGLLVALGTNNLMRRPVLRGLFLFSFL